MLEQFKKRYILTGKKNGALVKLAFTSERSAKKVQPIMERVYDLGDSEIQEIYLIPENMIDGLAQAFLDLAISNEEEAETERLAEIDREKYLRTHTNEYWNTKEQVFKEKPIPVWSIISNQDGGWWRHITPEMYYADTDYYQELFDERGFKLTQAVAVRAPGQVESYLKENMRCTPYEKTLLEGGVVNLNSAGGYNSATPITVKESAREPLSTVQAGGITGILTPDGVWYPCNYEGHSELVRWLEENTHHKVREAYRTPSETAEGAMYVLFSHGRGLLSEVSVAYAHGSYLSTKSLEWLDDNMSVMSEEQQGYVESIIERKKEKVN